MLDFDAHIHTFQVDLTERASLDRINRAKEYWRAYVWQAEDRAMRLSRARPVVCRDCGARELDHFYTARLGGSTLCPGCFQGMVTRGVAHEIN